MWGVDTRHGRTRALGRTREEILLREVLFGMSGLKMVWYVELPDTRPWIEPGSYVTIEPCLSREEALMYLYEVWSMPPDIADFFIAETAAD